MGHDRNTLGVPRHHSRAPVRLVDWQLLSLGVGQRHHLGTARPETACSIAVITVSLQLLLPLQDYRYFCQITVPTASLLVHVYSYFYLVRVTTVLRASRIHRQIDYCDNGQITVITSRLLSQ